MSTYKARKDAANKGNFSHLKLLTTSALTAAGLMMSSGTALAEPAPNTTPGFTITEGQATVDNTTAGLETITLGSSIVQAEAPKINLGRDATLKILGTKGDIFAGHATSRVGLSQLFGTVDAKGITVVFTDANGFIVGESFVADVNSLILGTGQFALDELAAGDRFTFFQDNDGGLIEIQDGAQINIGEAGLAAFVAPTVKNAGVINAKLGKVAFAAGESVTIDLYGDGLFEVEVEGELADAYLENTGEINAEGGTVQMTALAAKDVADNIINLDGVTTVASATVQGGKIVLSGGNKGAVTVKGKADASGTDGGEIEITGQTVIADAGAEIDASGQNNAGSVLFGGAWQGEGDTPTSDYAYVDQNAIIRNNAGENGEGGEVVVWSDIATYFYGSIEALGGRVETSGKDFLEAIGGVTANEWLLDPRNLEVTNSSNFSRSVIDAGGIRTVTATGTSGGTTSRVSDGTIESALNNGTSVTLKTGPQDNGQGDIFVNAQIDKTAGGEATLRLEAHDDIFINDDIVSTSGELNVELIAEAFGGRIGTQTVDVNDSIRTNGGYVFVEGEDVNVNDDIISSGGDITLIAKDDNVDINSGGDLFSGGGKITIDADERFFAHSNATLDSTGSAGDVLIEADTFILDGTINAGDAKVTIGHNDENGQIDVGDSNGSDLRIDQGELNRITAGTLEIGQQGTGVDNNVQVDNANLFAFNQTIINTKTPDNGVTQNVLFQGSNTFKALTVNADDNITVDANAFINAYGDVEFNTDTNIGGVGSFNVGEFARVDSNGNDITVNTLDVNIGANAEIDAEGGNIDFNNTGVFSNTTPGSLRTSGTGETAGTIEVNQNGGDAEGASIQNVIDALANTGTGQNTIFTDSSTYTENLTVDQANLKIDGDNTVIVAANTANQLINVLAENFNLDPVTLDGAGLVDYGIFADGVGADGLVSDGNTFKNFNEAGIYIARNAATTGTIIGNTFEGSSTRGVETGTLDGDYTLNITGNTIGTDGGGEVLNGLLFGQVRDANVNISGGSIDAGGGSGAIDGDGINFTRGLFSGAKVDISDITIVSDGDEAVDFHQSVRSGSTAKIYDGSFTGGNNGIEFSAIAGEATIGDDNMSTQVVGQGEDKRGINLLGSITGALKVINSRVAGGDDAIGSNNNQNNTVNGGTVLVQDSRLFGKNGDGLELGAVTNSADVDVIDSDFRAKDNGIHFVNGVDASTVDIVNPDIFAENNGILFGAGSPSVSGGSTVNINGQSFFGILAGVNGILFEDVVEGSSTIDIDGIEIDTSDVEVDIDLSTGINSSASASGNSLNTGDGIQFNGIDASTVTIQNSEITATNGNGILFAANTLNNRSFNGGTTEVKNNTITGTQDGIKATGVVSGTANVAISNSNDITGDQNGISFEEVISGNSTVKIADNTSIEGVNGDGVEFKEVISGSATVEVTGNDSIVAGENGVSFEDTISGGATITVSGNNDGIEADDHGIYFGGTITGDADVDIHDNIIQANLDEDGTGSGIWFGGVINNADVSIGDGNGGNGVITASPSNVIFVAKNSGGSDTNLDGIHFDNTVGTDADIDIDGNRIGYKAPSGLGGNIVGGFTNEIANDGIAFDGAIEGNADIDITDNFINSDDEGIEFDETISGTVDIEIGGSSGDTNTIIADDNAIQFGGNVTGQSLIEISHNDIDAFGNGIVFGGVVNNAVTSGSNEQEIYIAFNDINVDEDGIVFEEDVRNARHDQLITKNTIDAEENGIVYEEDIDDAHVRIIDDNDINARFDAIAVRDDLQNGARLDINNNTNIIAQFGDGVEISEDINGGSVLNIQNNDNIDAGNNGIEINGVVTGGSTVNITGNNHGIDAGLHGVYFGSSIGGGSTVNIHDNIISANENTSDGLLGNGIQFDGDINNADINIGDGAGPDYFDNPSNIIRGIDGIQFAGNINNNADIEIDGNRLGYHRTSGGSNFSDELGDDGIQFLGSINGNAEIDITDNRIFADDDGISFIKSINDTASVNIGGLWDANALFTDGDGIQFEGDITDSATISVTHNDINAEEDGIEFNGNIDNTVTGPISQQEIYIAYNDIYSEDENGIKFTGEISDNRHDTRITQNTIDVQDGGENGILFEGDIDDASIWIVNGNNIDGDEDGIKFNGEIRNEARIRIHGNDKIAGDDQDGIDFNGDITTGSFVSIIDNEVINGDLFGLESTFDSGIEFDGEINDAKIQILENNDGIMAEDHGIAFNDDILNGSDIDIHDNIIMSNTDYGQDGAGIWFGGEIKNSTVNIGDGTLNGAPSNIISVGDNYISDDVSDLDGIHFDETIGKGAEILIDGNRIGYKVGKKGLYVKAITDDGIEFSTIKRDAVVEVTDNRIHADDDGIQFSNRITDNAQVTIGETEDDADGNKIWAGDDGISFLGQIRENAVVNVNTNEIDADDDGIFSRGGMKGGELTITDNHSIVGGDNGIKIIGDLLDYEDTDALINITGNDEILGQDQNGIHIYDMANDGSTVNIGGPGEDEGNIINGNGENGIKVEATSIELLIEGNETNENGNDGILLIAKGSFALEEEEPDFEFTDSITSTTQLLSDERLVIVGPKEIETGVFNSTIINNDISNNGYEGLHVDGEGHNNVVLVGNTFTDNPTGARFESGKVDVTNTENPNIFTVTEDFMAPEGFDFVTGMQFQLSNEESPAESLTIVEETLGTTIFEGYGDRPVEQAFYVRFENGAILDGDGNVIEIDALNVQFDDVTPALVPNFLFNSPQLQAIEDRLFDADDPDVNGRGQIFVNLGDLIELAPEDFLQDRGFGRFGTSGLNVTVTGLPSIDGTNLAAIQPAAGEEGETPEDLAAIEPAAGEQAACWGDAIDAASTGAPVNYSYGGTFEESLSDASACSSTFQ